MIIYNRNEKENPIELSKPECIDKPKEELTEDEIKQIKEYEKKVEAYMVILIEKKIHNI